MKKTYMKPTTKVVYIHHTQHLLSASPDVLSTYSGDDDAISEKENIW